MKALQWSMTIAPSREKKFIKWFYKVAAPKFREFGALKHELYKVEDKMLVGKQIIEKDRYIERVYFSDTFNISDYFKNVKNDSEAWEISRSYEDVFGAKDIELRIINEVKI